MSFLATFAATAVLFTGAMAATIRFAAMDPKRWHVDPESVPRSGKPNEFRVTRFGAPSNGDLVAGVYDVPFQTLCRMLEEAALEQPRTRRLAGDEMLGHVTLVQRSKWMGYPDAISILTHPVDLSDDSLTSTVSILSRSRYGHADFGVNRARVLRMLAAVKPFLSVPQPAA